MNTTQSMKKEGQHIVLGIESSCDDTAAAICIDGTIVSNVVVNQTVHEQHGGVVPELASRAHLANVVPGISAAIDEAGISLQDISAIAVTQGPGLMGSLVVGLCFAKGLSAGLNVPLIPVHHMNAHVMSCLIDESRPTYPFLCLTISGGHTQLTIVHSFDKMEVIGKTRDDAAGEAFDKIGKLIGLPYPAGPHIDRLADQGENLFDFTRADIPDFDFSFSGLKTQVMYFLRDRIKSQPDFLTLNKHHVAASVRRAIVDMLLLKLKAAADMTGLNQIALAGGVSANKLLRNEAQRLAEEKGWTVFIPPISYCTDNAAMVAITGYLKFINGHYAGLEIAPFAKSTY